MPRSTRSGSSAVRDLIVDLGAIPAEVHKEAKGEFVRATQSIADDARGRASWSSRIPGALRVRPARSRKRPGAQIVVSKAKAPHARLYEFGHDRRGFRHPVFGNTEDRKSVV